MKRSTDPEIGTKRPAGIVLAAGRSVRMKGESKLLARFGGDPIVRRVASTGLSAGLDPVIVVVRRDDEGVRSALAGLPVLLAQVRGSEEGRLVSAVTGIEALREGPRGSPETGALILLGDEPGLSIEHVGRLLGAIDADPPAALRMEYSDRPGHPVYLPPGVLGSIPALARGRGPETGLWQLLATAGVRLGGVAVDSPAPIDIDTPEDLARAVERDAAG